MSGAFDFDTRDTFAFDQRPAYVKDNTNSNRKGNGAFRKLTLDESLKIPIFGEETKVEVPNFKYNTRRK